MFNISFVVEKTTPLTISGTNMLKIVKAFDLDKSTLGEGIVLLSDYNTAVSRPSRSFSFQGYYWNPGLQCFVWGTYYCNSETFVCNFQAASAATQVVMNECAPDGEMYARKSQ